MRNKLLFCMALAAAIVLLAAVVVGSFDRRDRDRDVVAYNVLAERMFEGIASSKGHIIEGLMYFPLRTANTMMEVQIGPKQFVERSGFKLNTGDRVTVIGMAVTMKEPQVVLAREVIIMHRVLIVRDEVGLPLWEKDRPTLMDPEHRISFSDECAVTK